MLPYLFNRRLSMIEFVILYIVLLAIATFIYALTYWEWGD